MDILDNPNNYKKLCDDVGKFFNNKNQDVVKGVDNEKLKLLNELKEKAKELDDYKELNNTRVEKLFKLIEINTQNDKNNVESLEKIKQLLKEMNDYKKLNDGRIEKLAKLFLLLNNN